MSRQKATAFLLPITKKMVDRNTLHRAAHPRLLQKRISFRRKSRHPTSPTAAGALVMLDDYQDCGTRPVDVKALDVDFYVTGTLKYLLGPPGLAFLYVRKELISSLAPTVTGWFGQANPFAYNPQHFELLPPREDSSQDLLRCPMCTPRCQVSSCCRKSAWRMWQAISKPHAIAADLRPDLAFVAKTPTDSTGPLVGCTGQGFDPASAEAG